MTSDTLTPARICNAVRLAVRAHMDGDIPVEAILPAIDRSLAAVGPMDAPADVHSMLEFRRSMFVAAMRSRQLSDQTTVGAIIEGLRFRDEGSSRAGPTPSEFDYLFQFARAVMNDDTKMRAFLNEISESQTLAAASERRIHRGRTEGHLTAAAFDTELARARQIEVTFREAATRALRLLS